MGSAADPGFQVVFALQPVERRVDGADGGAAPDRFLEPLLDGHAVGVPAQSVRGQKHDLFEFAEPFAFHGNPLWWSVRNRPP